MDESNEPYSFLCITVEGGIIKVHSIRPMATRLIDDDFEVFFSYLLTSNTADDDEEEENGDENDGEVEMIEDKLYNESNELVKTFKQKCVVCLEKDGVYAFRNCGHQCLCEECYNSEMMIWAVCGT